MSRTPPTARPSAPCGAPGGCGNFSRSPGSPGFFCASRGRGGEVRMTDEHPRAMSPGILQQQREEDARSTGAILLAVAATAVGLFGVVMLGAAVLTAAGPGLTVIHYSDSDDSERAIGIAMGIAGLVVWLAGFLSAAVVGFRGARPSRGRRITVSIVLGISGIVMLAALIVVLSATPALIEQAPAWNRA
nr:hypothetical protein [Microbacterium sp. CSI-V]